MLGIIHKLSGIATGALSLVIFCVFVAWVPHEDSSIEKKLDKLVDKVFGEDVLRTELDIPDSVLIFPEDDEVCELKEDDELLGYLILNKAYCCRVGGCAAWDPEEQDEGHDIFYYATITNPDLTINTIRVIEYHSEYGYEITSKQWLKQFEGKTGCDLNFGEDIDGISGATISAESMVYNIDNTCQLLQNLLELDLIAKAE